MFAGFNNTIAPCCSSGRMKPGIECVPEATLCRDRSKFFFWDESHTSDSGNEFIANELMKKFGFVAVNANAHAP